MTPTPTITTLPSSFCPCSRTDSFKPMNPPLISTLFNLKPLKFATFPQKISNFSPKSNSISRLNLYPDEEKHEICPISSCGLVSLRLRRLVSEFRSLPEPIDRVKRLLDYATVLPQLGESTRSPENRVPGCAAQVWLEVEKDEFGRMRFRADSDSEITKGFCSCLIFLLDGASPQEVLKVKAEDLADMNVGLPVRSRVNSWNNVLIGMQEKTRNFLPERDQELCRLDPLETFPSFVVSPDSIVAKGEVFIP